MQSDPPTFWEWLGDIDTETLFQNMKNVVNPNLTDRLRRSFPRGFMVMVLFNKDRSGVYRIELHPLEAQEESNAA
jgi:hypothetical protein